MEFLVFVVSHLEGWGHNVALPVVRHSLCMAKRVSKVEQVKQKLIFFGLKLNGNF